MTIPDVWNEAKAKRRARRMAYEAANRELARTPVTDLAGSGLRLTALQRAGVRTLLDIDRRSVAQLRAIPGVGDMTASTTKSLVHNRKQRHIARYETQYLREVRSRLTQPPPPNPTSQQAAWAPSPMPITSQPADDKSGSSLVYPIVGSLALLILLFIAITSDSDNNSNRDDQALAADQPSTAEVESTTTTSEPATTTTTRTATTSTTHPGPPFSTSAEVEQSPEQAAEAPTTTEQSATTQATTEQTATTERSTTTLSPTTATTAAPATTQHTQPSGCHPNYSGCVPIASDVDCAGGSGDGPAYTGKVKILGPDVYGLDRDDDGWGCE